MRRLAAILLLLASCGGPPSAESVESDSRTIECRPAGAAAYAANCTLESAPSADGSVLTLRKPDGGFRRLLLADDERGLVAADGAEQPGVALLPDGRIEVALGGDRFRLPAMAGPP
jgi:hypothetical protein